MEVLEHTSNDMRDEKDLEWISLEPRRQIMLRIVTDGAADIPAGWEKEYGINIIPINILFGEKTYLQNVDLDTRGFL